MLFPELPWGVPTDLAKAMPRSTLISAGLLHQTVAKPMYWPCPDETSGEETFPIASGPRLEVVLGLFFWHLLASFLIKVAMEVFQFL